MFFRPRLHQLLFALQYPHPFRDVVGVPSVQDAIHQLVAHTLAAWVLCALSCQFVGVFG